MLWLAFALGVAGVVGLVLCVVQAVSLRRRLHDLGDEARRLGDAVRRMQATIDDLGPGAEG